MKSLIVWPKVWCSNSNQSLAHMIQICLLSKQEEESFLASMEWYVVNIEFSGSGLLTLVSPALTD